MGDHDKLNNRREELHVCHRSLGMVLSFLIPLENKSVTNSKKEDGPPSYSSIFENPQMARKMRQRHLSEDSSNKPTGKLFHQELIAIELY